jgi:hypothetical protein
MKNDSIEYHNGSTKIDIPTRNGNIAFDAIFNEQQQFLSTGMKAIRLNDKQLDKFFLSAPLTDTGNAECFVHKYKKSYRFNVSIRQWMKWNGVVWETDHTSQIDADILATVRLRRSLCEKQEVFDDVQSKAKKKRAAFLLGAENVPSRKNIKQAAEWQPALITTIADYRCRQLSGFDLKWNSRFARR